MGSRIQVKMFSDQVFWYNIINFALRILKNENFVKILRQLNQIFRQKWVLQYFEQ